MCKAWELCIKFLQASKRRKHANFTDLNRKKLKIKKKMSKSSKKTDSKSDSNKVDTRYYDELFKRLKDDESDEFNDKEALGKSSLI